MEPHIDREQIRRKGFAEFVKRAWPQVEAAALVWEPHMGLVCAHYEAVARGEIKELVVNVPPGTSKSIISSVLFPAWDWIDNPWRKFLYVTYDRDLSLDFARRSKELMQGEWFRARWSEWEVRGGDRASNGLFKNSMGGVRFSTMMGGAATGRHAHILIVDDPTKPDDLRGGGDAAKLVLDQAWVRWSETFCRRVADAGSFAKVCIMQRLHQEDLAGRMIKDPKTVHLSLPMLFEPSVAYRSRWGSDWRTEEGELLCPKRFPLDYVLKLRDGSGSDSLSPRAFAAQMQQRPTPEAGSLFMREWFTKRWDRHPDGAKWLMSVDASLKDHNDADYSVIQVWAWKGAQYYLMDQTRARMAFSATLSAVRAMKAKWPAVGQILVEDKANGTAVVDVLRRSTPGVLAVSPEGGKLSRAQSVEPFFRAGNVLFPPDTVAPWMPALVEEFAVFPYGSYDDSVDAASQALLFASGRTRGSAFRNAMDTARKALTSSPRLRYRR